MAQKSPRRAAQKRTLAKMRSTKRQEHSFDERLHDRGLLPSTREKYTEISERMDLEDPIAWLKSQVHARTPIGTVLPLRATVKHYLVGELGYTEEEVDDLLPKAMGRKAARRDALNPTQLAVYHMAVGALGIEPAHTILMLLPQTGLRISEACGLHRKNLRQVEGRWVLELRGKGDKHRVVPLNRAAETTLFTYFKVANTDGWLFPGRADLGGPIGPHAIRKYTRAIAEDYPDLEGLSPHVLRHTFATMSLRRGMNLSQLQQLLGHESIVTTQRYLHPTVGDLVAAVDLLD